MTPIQLKEILDQHQLWLDSDGEQGRRADLRGANLTAARLRGAYLRGAELGPEIRECYCFAHARVSEGQLAWLCLHPEFGEWVSGLEIT